MGVDCDTEEGRLQMRMKRNERRKRDFIPPNARDGAEVSLRRPTHSQERMRKKKSACSVRNDRLEAWAGEDGGLKAAATREGSGKAQSSERRQGCFGCGAGAAGATPGVADGACAEDAADCTLAKLFAPVCGSSRVVACSRTRRAYSATVLTPAAYAVLGFLTPPL